MSETMELTRDTLEAIGGYVKQNLATWIRDVERPPQTDPHLLERIVRVEDELRSSRELMKQGFDLMEKRFEVVDQRFEDLRGDMIARFEAVDKRFEDLRTDMNARFEQVDKRFEAVDKRFEAVDKRFEAVDKRFEDLRADMNAGFDRTDRHMNRWMTMLTIVIAVAALAGPLIAAFLS